MRLFKNKQIIRVLALLVSVLMLVPFFAACDKTATTSPVQIRNRVKPAFIRSIFQR